MLAALASAAAGGGGGGLSGGGQSSADTTSQSASLHTEIQQGNISFGGKLLDGDSAKWIAGAIVAAVVIYFLAKRKG